MDHIGFSMVRVRPKQVDLLEEFVRSGALYGEMPKRLEVISDARLVALMYKASEAFENVSRVSDYDLTIIWLGEMRCAIGDIHIC